MLAAHGWRFTCWDGDVVVYDIATGDTHHLGWPAGHVVSTLFQVKIGLNACQIAAALPSTIQLELTQAGEALQSSIEALCNLGLIAPGSLENSILLTGRPLPPA